MQKRFFAVRRAPVAPDFSTESLCSSQLKDNKPFAPHI